MSAAAFTSLATPFNAQSTLVGQFPSCQLGTSGTAGPMGGLDDGTNLYFTDWCNDTLYRLGANVLAGGGSATTPAASKANGLDSGIALSHGVYYGIAQTKSQYVKGGLYAFNPNTLALTTASPLVAAASFGTGTPKGVASDPQSTDLYVSSDNGIYRVQNPLSANPTVTQFAPGNFDGLDFNNAGTVLYAAQNVGVTAGQVIGFDRAGNTVLQINVGGGPDGIAVAPPVQATTGVNVANNLFINNNNGTVERIDTNNANQVSIVASGGSRGDLAFVDSQGGLDVSQSGSYVRLTPPLFGTPPASSSPPVITGPASTPGSLLTCAPGTWSGSPGYSYQWRSDGAPIAHATSNRYTIVSGDVAHWLTCAVTATNAAGAAVAVSNAVLVTPVPGPPVNSGSGPPPPSGSAVVCSLAVHKLAVKPSPKLRHKNGKRNRATLRALQFVVRCNQALRGVVTSTIRLTRPPRRSHGKVRVELIHLHSLDFSAGAGTRVVLSERLSATLLRSLAGARTASGTFVLAAANGNGTVGLRRPLTLL